VTEPDDGSVTTEGGVGGKGGRAMACEEGVIEPAAISGGVEVVACDGDEDDDSVNNEECDGGSDDGGAANDGSGEPLRGGGNCNNHAASETDGHTDEASGGADDARDDIGKTEAGKDAGVAEAFNPAGDVGGGGADVATDSGTDD
jgi:hypothetical protein